MRVSTGPDFSPGADAAAQLGVFAPRSGAGAPLFGEADSGVGRMRADGVAVRSLLAGVFGE